MKAVLDTIEKDNLLERVVEAGDVLDVALQDMEVSVTVQPLHVYTGLVKMEVSATVLPPHRYTDHMDMEVIVTV